MVESFALKAVEEVKRAAERTVQADGEETMSVSSPPTQTDVGARLQHEGSARVVFFM